MLVRPSTKFLSTEHAFWRSWAWIFNIGCASPVRIQIKIQIGQISELDSNLKDLLYHSITQLALWERKEVGAFWRSGSLRVKVDFYCFPEYHLLLK